MKTKNFKVYTAGKVWHQDKFKEKQNEEQRGALVELGMAYGFGKPVYAVGTCKTIQPTKISDVAFTHYHDFHWLPTSDLEVGYKMAINRELNKLRKVG